MTNLVFATGRHQQFCQWERWAFVGASDLEICKLCNAKYCTRISWSPTLPDSREVLEHHYAAKQQLVNTIWGKHTGDLNSIILKRWPKFDFTHSNQYQIGGQCHKVTSRFIQSGRDYIAASAPGSTPPLIQCWSFGIDWFTFTRRYVSVSWCRVGGGSCMWSKSNTDIVECCKLTASIHFTLCLKRSQGLAASHFIIRWITAVWMQMHFIIPWLMTMMVIYSCHWSCLPAAHCTILSWSGEKTNVFILKASQPKLKTNSLDYSNSFSYQNGGVKYASCCTPTDRKLLTSPGVVYT